MDFFFPVYFNQSPVNSTYRNRFASSMNGRFCPSVSNFHRGCCCCCDGIQDLNSSGSFGGRWHGGAGAGVGGAFWAVPLEWMG